MKRVPFFGFEEPYRGTQTLKKEIRVYSGS